MKNTIEGFELVFDESNEALLLCKKVDGKECFLQIEILRGSKTTWSEVVEDQDDYHNYIGDKLQQRLKKAIYNAINNK